MTSSLPSAGSGPGLSGRPPPTVAPLPTETSRTGQSGMATRWPSISTSSRNAGRERHPERDDVLRRACDTVTVAGDPLYTSADGEIYGPVQRRTWTLKQGTLRMVLPEQGPATSG